MLANGVAIQYLKPVPSNTTTLSLEFSGGWRQRIPFNFTLSDPVGGVRGYSGSNTPGARRFVARLRYAAVSWAVRMEFADVGFGASSTRAACGRATFPMASTPRCASSIGVSLLGSVPPNSPRIWRLDLAYALNPEFHGRRLRASLRQLGLHDVLLARAVRRAGDAGADGAIERLSMAVRLSAGGFDFSRSREPSAAQA